MTIVPAAGALLLAASLAGAGSARVHGRAFPYGAPPGTTGGFGEPTCMQCHFDGELNAAGGSLDVDGLPERYTPGETYRLIVRLRHAGTAAAGFQLSARTADGAQAGVLAAPTPHTQVQAGSGSVQYVPRRRQRRQRRPISLWRPRLRGGTPALSAVTEVGD
jgi:hypothetical protein